MTLPFRYLFLILYSATYPGKIILSGEHSVVYGYPALLCSLNLFATATIDASLPPAPLSPFLNSIISLTYNYFHLPYKPLNLTISSDIPQNSGLGSSAAVAAATIKAISLSLHHPLTLKQLNHLVFLSEKNIHHHPSGADNVTVTHQGLIYFVKTNFKKYPLKTLPPFVLINSGSAQESTATMVKLVKSRLQKHPITTKNIFEKISLITDKFLSFLSKNTFSNLPQLIHQNHLLLNQLGIVSDSTNKLILSLNKLGAVAKVCGAGGIKTNSGILLCLHKHPQVLISFAKKHHLTYFANPFLNTKKPHYKV